MSNSICIFHNGNKNVISYYKNKFSNLKFVGNWAEFPYQNNSLYEISHVDATYENLFELKKTNTKIIRHISDYDDDQKNLINESPAQTYKEWLEHTVIKFLSLSDEIICDFKIKTENNGLHAIITTGRSASTHLEMYLKNQNILSFEIDKSLFFADYISLLNSKSATFLWREDDWECLTSNWISLENDDFVHARYSIPFEYNFTQVKEIDTTWMAENWVNICGKVMDLSIAYKVILGKSIDIKTTENIILNYKSDLMKIPYDKSKLIDNYHISKQWYYDNIHSKIADMYSNAKKLLE